MFNGKRGFSGTLAAYVVTFGSTELQQFAQKNPPSSLDSRWEFSLYPPK